MDRSRFRGHGPALITPMRADGSVDLDGLSEHIRFCMDGGVHFLVPCGTTGESATMDAKEQLAVIERTLEVAGGKVPVMAGAGSNSTKDACARAKAAAAAGADAVLTVTPYYNRPSPEGLHRHYMAVADAAGIPVFAYNVPGRTGCNMTAATLLRLAESHPLIAGVKEASGDLQQVMSILKDRPQGFVVLSGEDHLVFPLMALGGDGGITVAGNELPRAMSEMVEAGLGGSWDRAREIHYRLLPLLRANFLETNPVPVKTALELMGRGKAYFRPPLCEMSAENLEPLRRALAQAGVDLGAKPERKTAAAGR